MALLGLTVFEFFAVNTTHVIVVDVSLINASVLRWLFVFSFIPTVSECSLTCP